MKSLKSPLKPDQKKQLIERLRAASYAKKSPHETVIVPREVRAARKIARSWDAKVFRISARHDRRVEKARAAVNEAITFGSVEQALAAVKAFEAKVFK